jgi:hypothetical protein
LALAVALGALTIGSPASPLDLTVQELTVQDARGAAAEGRMPEVGDELYIRCRLTARGTGAPDTVSFVFRVDGSVVRQLTVPVPIGAPVTIGEYWTPAAPGAHEVACEADPDRKAEDAARGDNSQRRSVEVRPKGSAAAAAPVPAAPAPKQATPSPAPPATAPAAGRPDLAIVAVTTAADPGCARKDPSVTVHVTVKNVGETPFVPPRNSALLDITVKVANQPALIGRKAVPQLAPGASAELDVVARNRSPVASAGGLRYAAVIIVNGDSKVEETTLDNNGEYVKAVFPPC